LYISFARASRILNRVWRVEARDRVVLTFATRELVNATLQFGGGLPVSSPEYLAYSNQGFLKSLDHSGRNLSYRTSED
jgi:hypothetical protein